MSRREISSCASKCIVRLISRAAIGTNAAQQTLPEHGLERGGNQERLHAHVDQARDRAGRVVRVQSVKTRCPVSEA